MLIIRFLISTALAFAIAVAFQNDKLQVLPATVTSASCSVVSSGGSYSMSSAQATGLSFSDDRLSRPFFGVCFLRAQARHQHRVLPASLADRTKRRWDDVLVLLVDMATTITVRPHNLDDYLFVFAVSRLLDWFIYEPLGQSAFCCLGYGYVGEQAERAKVASRDPEDPPSRSKHRPDSEPSNGAPGVSAAARAGQQGEDGTRAEMVDRSVRYLTHANTPNQ